MQENELIISPNVSLVHDSEVPGLLSKVRPSWQAKDLINRVRKLIDVDPSSACQRLFNAAIHDLREKVVIAGIDIAKQAAKQHKLPSIEKDEDVEEYSTSNLITLAFRMGLLTRPEWRRVSRCYEIRRDLEHEDNEYEAGIEDCIYIFKTCVEVILAVDPVHLLRVEDVKQVIEQPTPTFPSDALLEEYEHAPQPRQEEICKFLISVALDDSQSEVVRQNACIVLSHIRPRTQDPVKLRLAGHIQDRVDRRGLDRLHMLVAVSAGVVPYLKKAYVSDYFKAIFQQMQAVGHHWRGFNQHGELLRSFQEVGDLELCPPLVRPSILKWLVLAYLGVPGGQTVYGNIRNVYYSNTAAPLIEEIMRNSKQLIKDELKSLAQDKDVKKVCSNLHIAKRYESLLDIVEANMERSIGE
ncbi:MAG: hypothetical protein WC749_17030 [Dehalococcoidia bacterium]